MNRTATLSHPSRNPLSPVIINRLVSIEDELTDRLNREENGRRVVQFCRKLGTLLIPGYSPCEDDQGELRHTFCSNLVESLKCSECEATALFDLTLDFVHARLYDNYRRPNVDLSLLVATASGALRDISAN